MADDEVPPRSLAMSPYAALGLTPGADEATVRQAFRRLARELHPDRNPAPDAAEAFLRVRAAYEALASPALREAAEAEVVVEAAIRAAEAACLPARARREASPLLFPFETGRLGLPVASAGRAAVALSVSAVGAVGFAALTGAVAFVLAGGVSLAGAAAVWLTRRRPSELRLYGDGFADGRWEEAGRIGWGDVYALDPDYASGTLDLALSASVAARLAGLAERPRDVLVWEGDRPFYRLPLGERLDGVIAAVEARTGLRRP